MTLYVDNREKNDKLKQMLASRFDIQEMYLPASDILIAGSKENILIERMSILDCLGKIRSGRLQQQIYKMKQLSDNYRLIVESPFLIKFTKWKLPSVVALLGSIAEKNKLFISSNIQWTFYYVSYLYGRYNDEGKSISKGELRAKPKDMSTKEQAVYALSGIAGIGEVTAMKLLMQFDTLYGVASADLESLETQVNPKLAKNIYQVMHFRFGNS